MSPDISFFQNLRLQRLRYQLLSSSITNVWIARAALVISYSSSAAVTSCTVELNLERIQRSIRLSLFTSPEGSNPSISAYIAKKL